VTILDSIRERLEKVVIAAPIEQAGIYSSLRDDIRYLLSRVDALEQELEAYRPKDAA
jgi:hypothetical protein